MNTINERPGDNDEQQSPAEHDNIRQNDNETEEKTDSEQTEEAQKAYLDGPSIDLVEQPASTDKTDDD